MQFKQTYELSSELGEYIARENVLRLFAALVNDADSIMNTLELRFGNKNAIVEKLVAGVRKLPNLLTGAIDVVSFATKLHSAIMAIKSIDDVGYLFNRDFLKEVLKKLTPTMASDFVKSVTTLDKTTSILEKLSEFVYAEAERYAKIGTVDLVQISSTDVHK